MAEDFVRRDAPLFDVLVMNKYIKFFLRYHSEMYFDDLLYQTFQIMMLKKKIPKTMPRMVWTAILIGDMVMDAGLLHPDHVPDFVSFKGHCMGKSIDTSVEDAFISFVKDIGDEEYDKSMHWFVSVMSVARNFLSFKWKQVKPAVPEEHTLTTKLIRERRNVESEVKHIITDTQDGAVRGILVNVPDFRYGLIMDFECHFQSKGRTEVIGVSQAKVNHREADGVNLLKMAGGFRDGDVDAVVRKNYMFPEEKVITFYAAVDPDPEEAGVSTDQRGPVEQPPTDQETEEQPDEGTEIAGEDGTMIGSKKVRVSDKKIVGALVLESEVERGKAQRGVDVSVGTRVAHSITVSEALRFASLWQSKLGCKKGLLARGYTLELKKEEFVSLKTKNGALIDLSADTPDVVIDILTIGLNGRDTNRCLDRESVGPTSRTMIASYMIEKYGLDARYEVLESYVANGHNVDRVVINTESYHTDKIGMIWLVNLASHRVRMGAVSGRHRFIAQLMAMNGSYLMDVKSRPPYLKNDLSAQLMVDSDFVFHIVNGCNTTKFSLSTEESLLNVIKEDVRTSEMIDTASDHKVANKFGNMLEKALNNAVGEFETIHAFRYMNMNYDCYMCPWFYSIYFTFMYKLDLEDLDPGKWSIKLPQISKNTIGYKTNMHEDDAGKIMEYASCLADSKVNVVNRHQIGLWSTVDSNSHFVKEATLYIKKHSTGTMNFDIIGGPYRVEWIKKYLHESHLQLFSDKVIRSVSTGHATESSRASNQTAYKPEEFVHCCIYMTLFRNLVQDSTFLANFAESKRCFPGAVAKHFMTGTVTTGFNLSTTTSKDIIGKCLPENLQLLIYILTLLITHERGKYIISSYFFSSRMGQEDAMKQRYVSTSFHEDKVNHWSKVLFPYNVKDDAEVCDNSYGGFPTSRG